MGFHVIHASGYYGWRFKRDPNRFRMLLHGQPDEIVSNGDRIDGPMFRLDGPMSVYADGFESYYLSKSDKICINADGSFKRIDESKPTHDGWVLPWMNDK